MARRIRAAGRSRTRCRLTGSSSLPPTPVAAATGPIRKQWPARSARSCRVPRPALRSPRPCHPAPPGTVTNTAHVQANEPDPNSGNDTDSETTDVVQRTDLAIDKRDDGSDAVAGTRLHVHAGSDERRPVGFERGDGHGYAAGPLAVRLVLQRQLQRQRGRSGNGDLHGRSACVGRRGPASRSPWPCHPAPSPGTVTNTAHVQANESDPNSGNDTDSETTVVVRQDGSGDRQAGRRLGRGGGNELHVHAGGDERRPVGFERGDGHGYAAGPLAVRLVHPTPAAAATGPIRKR